MTGSLQIKNDKYFIVLNDKTNGIRKQKWIATGLDAKGNKRKAEALLVDTLQEYKEVDLFGTKDMLFSDFMLVWLESAKHSIKENTYHEYRKVIVNDIVPYFKKKGIRMKELNNMHLQEYYNFLVTKMSACSVIKRHANIHKALQYAVMSKLITSNPSDYVILPKKQKFKGKFYDEKTMNKLFEVSKDYPIESAIKLGGYYGLRRSEVLGLKWADIDFDNCTILIHNTVVSIGGHAFEADETKNESSTRTLPLDNSMLIYLKQLKLKQKENKVLYGNTYCDNDFICKWENGQPFKPDYISQTFKKLLDENKLPIIRFHDLRHSSASMLINSGFQMKEIQEWLGHSDEYTTSKFYAHLDYQHKVKMSANRGKKLKVNG